MGSMYNNKTGNEMVIVFLEIISHELYCIIIDILGLDTGKGT